MISKATEIQIIDFLENKFPELSGIYIYGSYAINQENQESDIDIAFLTEEKITTVEKWKIQEELAAKLDKDVDLVDLKNASVVLRKEIIEKGKLIYSTNQYKVESFEMTTLSMYIDLNETRKNILNDYREKYGRNSDK
jgi:predicted nucleotidyltransferase